MQKIILSISILLTGLITGCSGGLPKCSDTEAIDTVIKIANERYGIEPDQNPPSIHKFSLSAIRTIETNKRKSAHSCAAQFNIHDTLTNTTMPFAITYTIELTDKGDEFLIMAYGFDQ